MSAKITTGTVKIERDNINSVKLAVIGTGYNIASFYAEAAIEKIERDKLRGWADSLVSSRNTTKPDDV